jgi:hypothetical protein
VAVNHYCSFYNFCISPTYGDACNPPQTSFPAQVVTLEQLRTAARGNLHIVNLLRNVGGDRAKESDRERKTVVSSTQ